MKTSLSHIPKNKRQELEEVVSTIQKIADKTIGVEMVILFGSYARGDFVEKDVVMEGNNAFEYKSDFDLLVVTKKPSAELNVRMEREINKKLLKDKSIDTPVSVIVEDIKHINARLEENRYFYLDIKREGVALLDSGKVELGEARELSKEEELKLKQGDYDFWTQKAESAMKKYYFSFEEGLLNEGAFELHQATERYITAYLLVKTGYKPKTHQLDVLYEKLKEFDDDFYNWFDLENESKYFDLLKRAYVDARYSKEYSITKEELQFLEMKVLQLKEKVEKLCEQELT